MFRAKLGSPMPRMSVWPTRMGFCRLCQQWKVNSVHSLWCEALASELALQSAKVGHLAGSHLPHGSEVDRLAIIR